VRCAHRAQGALGEILGKASLRLAYSSHIPEDGEAALRLAGERDFEGIISKRADSHYSRRTWRRLAQGQNHRLRRVGRRGYTPLSGSKIGNRIAAASQGDTRRHWSYAGRVGTRSSDHVVRDLRRVIGKRASAAPTIAIDAAKARELTNLRSAKWIEPLFVIEANVRGTGGSGLLRQRRSRRCGWISASRTCAIQCGNGSVWPSASMPAQGSS
jgi:bifunctional non-homologous end joining protein LigD